MKSRMTSVVMTLAFLAALVTWSLTPSRVDAQAKPAQPKAAAKPAPTRSPGHVERPAREITLAGRVVSVHAFMTSPATTPNSEKITAENIRAGLPVALESPMGLIVLGQGGSGLARVLTPFAFQQVEIHGKLYEKGALKYLEIGSIEAVEDQDEDEEEVEEEEGE